ncbi:MAG: DNA primase [Myxococcota bacterium]
MGLIPSEAIEQLRDRVDLVDLIGRFVTLKRAGRSYKGLCPFHDEKTPSFNVNPDRGTFYCFGCHEGGDAIAFLMKVENLSFPESARTLARDCGIEIPETDDAGSGVTERLRVANELAHSHYCTALAAPDSPGASYLAQRGLDASTIARFGIGYAPQRWDFIVQALREHRVAAEDGEKAGLLARRDSGGHYDRLRGRVIFPIHDVRGRVVAFGGRAVDADQEPKYLNTPESPLFHKRQAFYGFPHALEPIRRAKCAVVVEGYFDLIALYRADVENVVATCGTALTTDHARALRRRTGHVVLLFDGDKAGQRATERALEILLPEGLRVSVVVLQPGDDPDTCLEREGAEALRARVDGARGALDVVIEWAVARGCGTPWEKADAVASVAKLLALVRDPVECSEYGRHLALAAGTEERHVEAAVRAAARGEDPADAVPVEVRRSGPEPRLLQELARSLVEHPQLAQRIERDEFGELVEPGATSELILALIDAAAEPRGVGIEEIAQRLGPEACTLLRSLDASEYTREEPAAKRTVDDTLGRLRRDRQRRENRALTQKMRETSADTSSLLREKDELRRRAVQKISDPSELGPHV